jgi:hypothetical protein
LNSAARDAGGNDAVWSRITDRRGVSDAKVTAQFQRMAGDYRRFKEHIEHANTEQASADLNAVTTPYKEVERRLRFTSQGSPS